VDATGGEPTRRRRRRPEEAEAEILEAARAFLAERPLRDLTIGALMERTTLSRKSFYVYFRDRHDVLARLVEPLRAERDAIVEALMREEDRAAAARGALVALARLYHRHGLVLRALFHASAEDAGARRAWRSFLEPVVAGHARFIADELERGAVRGPLDPEATARALIGMNLQVFFDRLVDDPAGDPEEVAETLLRIWTRALYG
jgi:TetR/AcrR family transcriptional regulator, ethionamide resistance regulator